MALFDESPGGALDVGGVKATLGYDHDTTGLRAWDRKVDEAEARARKPIEQDLRGDFHGAGFAQYSAASKRASTENDRLHRIGQKTGRTLAFVGRQGLIAGGYLSLGFAAALGASVKASSDLNESTNAANAIFEKQGPIIQKWSRGTADSFGFARSEALQYASSVGAMLKPMGFTIDKASVMSRRMVELAGDMASFNNQDPGDMLERIRSGLAGESEPLRQFGVDLRVTAVEQFALNRGLIEQGETLQGQKFTLAAYQKILSDTKDQQGDFGRTSDGLANLTRRLRANFIDLGASIGVSFRPLVVGAAKDLNEFIREMESGKGAGGDFRQTLDNVAGDVKGFMQEIGGILSDPHLSPEEKASKVFNRIAELAADAFDKAAPLIAESAAKAAPIAAGAFIRAFISSDGWGRLAIGAFLLSKFGGFGAIRKAGQIIGASAGAGVAEGTVAASASQWAAFGRTGTIAGAEAGAAGGGILGGIKTAFGKAGPIAKRLGGLGLGIALGDTVLNEFDRRTRAGSDDVRESLEAMAESTKFLGIPTDIFQAGLTENRADVEERHRMASNLLAQYEEMGRKRVKLSRFTIDDLRRQANELDLTKAQRQELERMFEIASRGRKLGVAVGLEQDPKALRNIQADLARLRAGVFTSAKDIEKASRRARKAIVDQFGSGTKEARRLTADNLRATAQAYATQMKRSGDYTKAGLERIKRMLRNADLIEGVDPDGFGRAWARMFGRAGDVTEAGLKKVIREMRKMKPGARQAAFEAMQAQLAQLVRGGQLTQKQARRIRSNVLAQFVGLKRDSVGSTFDLVKGVLLNFGSLGNGIATGLTFIRDNVNKGLGNFGVDPIKWAIKKLNNLWHGGQKQARGGFLRGPSREDVVPVLAGKDEFFATSWQQGPLEVGLAASQRMGLQPFGSLRELASGERRRHSAGPIKKGSGGYPIFPHRSYPGLSGDTDVNPQLGDALSAMARGTHTHIYIQDGGRTSAEQAAYQGGPNPAAPVGQSHHEFVNGAIAADITPGNEVFGGVAGRYGMGFPLLGIGEPWHIELLNAALAGKMGGAVQEIARVILQGPDGPLTDFGQAQLDQVRKAANDYLAKKLGGSGFVSAGGAGGNRQLGHEMMTAVPGRYHKDAGTMKWGPWGEDQWPPYDRLIQSESGWDEHATNPKSGAYGIPQSLPGDKMAAAGSDWRENPATQIAWGLDYIRQVYGSPSATPLGGYARGGFVGMQEGGDPTGKPAPEQPKKPKKTDAKPPPWILALANKSFGPVPKEIDACTHELHLRRGQLRELEDIASDPKGDLRMSRFPETMKIVKRALERLRKRIALLIRVRNRLVARRHRLVNRGVGRRGTMPRESARIAGFYDRIGSIEEDIRKDLAQEGETYTQADYDRQSALYSRELGQQFGLRNTLIEGQNAGQVLIASLTRQIGKMLKLPKQRWRVPALRAARSNVRSLIGTEWEQNLVDVQGPDGGHKLLRRRPPFGVLGGSYFDTENEIRLLGLKLSDAIANNEAPELEARNAALEELLRGRFNLATVLGAQAGIFANLGSIAGPFLGSFQTGTGPRGLPADGYYYGHEGERVLSVDEQKGGGAYFFVEADAAALGVKVREVTQEEFKRRGARASAASARPAVGAIARRR